MKIKLVFLFLLCTIVTFGQNINVKIFSGDKINSFVFYSKSGRYDIVAHNSIVCSIDEGNSVTITKRGHKIHIATAHGLFSADTLILIRGVRQDNIFQVRFNTRLPKAREYDNDLYVKTSNDDFMLINDVNFEKYIAGVVESEGGAKAGIEYYKAQAILCRTYAAKFYKRHLPNGYNLCDAVHCQAYVGRCRYSNDIMEAISATQGLVIVDENQNLIEATFSANSGGETSNSEDVWSKTIPYLRGKPDPYSVEKNGCEWNKTISKQDWKCYLLKNGYPVSDSTDFSFEQNSRKKYLETECSDSILPLATIRSDWKLRSTYFCIDSRENEIVLYGKGFGHGVGMSQEGAMEMARQGFNYKDILNFYYTKVSLMNISNLNFFQIK